MKSEPHDSSINVVVVARLKKGYYEIPNKNKHCSLFAWGLHTAYIYTLKGGKT